LNLASLFTLNGSVKRKQALHDLLDAIAHCGSGNLEVLELDRNFELMSGSELMSGFRSGIMRILHLNDKLTKDTVALDMKAHQISALSILFHPENSHGNGLSKSTCTSR